MSLAGEDKDCRTLGIVHNLAQPIKVAKQHCRPLVSRKTASETDGEYVRIFRIDILEYAIKVRL